MSQLHEVAEPIICDAYAEPTHHWVIDRGRPPEKVPGRREACYYYRPPERSTGATRADDIGTRIPLDLANEIRKRLGAWRKAGFPGATATTLELLRYWDRDDRERRLFFCQREAAETIIFLTEARADFRQGITIPRDEPGQFARDACKMATGSGKAFVKNFNLGFAIPYTYNNEVREYLPDFLVRLQKDGDEVGTLTLETKGYDPLATAKEAGARRWVAAVNTEGSHGHWAYRLIKSPTDTPEAIRSAADELALTFGRAVMEAKARA